jgi:polysaccharide export outer membrane protein
MTSKRTIVLAVLSLITITLAGCFSSHPKDIEAFIMPYKVNVTAETYLLQPPDEVEIHCSKVPEINLQHQQIRPDGKISFEALGEVQAAGKTPAELAGLLQEKAIMLYALTGEHPIDVRVVVYRSKVYYVLGEVAFPGPKEATGRDTALTALAEARPTVLAWLERIQVVRPSEDKKTRPKIFELNYDKMSAHGDTTKNVLLQEGDIIYVPPTVLAAISMKIEEVIRPIARAFSGVYITQSGGRSYGGGYDGGYR